ncbi:MAG: ribonuclease P protein component [Synechococcales cyanobacterium C42_A2020_086]|nr:ribonuclease P protein component [Synechococcales cyanobacterium C42_A2020_086]
MALPKEHRLKRRQEFNAVYQQGWRRSSPHLTLRGMRLAAASDAQAGGTLLKPTQIGISISQRVSKQAVVRNRIKRQLRAILRQLLPYMAPGWRLIVVVKPGAAQCGYEQFLQELKQLLINAEVINGY